ncbi:hypothetical protein BFW01_g9732 [Lasiodiplodia theobromae]|uniref:uncharacterized protein n=1 Tax=Lasiodiplodia theobromae TaxID=45133 RepID=UPI0015C3A3B9|nr:uncharacterized protein LTHEOB_2542 [Lasiodiplodia theobromae]KAF4535550.1 hypothetical protein LTHEOB_2542 [Lasiodiplodia theobromae]KAF9638835.1 hypothetical protein BFW01_g9732 [Lasiodiplodia theobromae]
MTDRKRRSALDRFLDPSPRYPSLSPDIEIGPDGNAIVDTSNGVDEVYFLSSHPISYNGPLEGVQSNDEQIDNYVSQFLIKKVKYRPEAKAKGLQEDDGSTEAETEADSVEDDDDTDEDNQDSSSRDSGEVAQPDNIFDTQARIWRIILKRREHAAIVQTTEALNQSLPVSDAWQTHLLVNATIRKIIYSLEGKSTPTIPVESLESVNPSALTRPDGGGLLITPGIQVTDDDFIPVFIRSAHKTSSFATSTSNGISSSSSNYKPDYRGPGTAFGKHPLAGGYYEPEEEDDDSNVTVHASLCIPCLRDLYVGAAIPEIATDTTTTVFPNAASSNNSADDCQQSSSTSGVAANPEPGQDQDNMPGFAEPGLEWPARASSSNNTNGGGGSGWNALNSKKTEEGDSSSGDTGQQQQQQQQKRYPAFGIPQLDGIGETQSGTGGGGSSGPISSGGLGCAIM